MRLGERMGNISQTGKRGKGRFLTIKVNEGVGNGMQGGRQEVEAKIS